MSDWIRSLFGRSLALVQIALLLSAGCSGGPLTPTPGSSEHQAPGMVRVAGGVVNAAGGNLMIERTDITLDSIVAGTQAITAVYNSSLPGWTWSFGARYDGATFSDATGRSFGVAQLADGAAIPGSHWLKIDGDTVQTKGGLAHHFDAQGRLASVRWATLEYPRIRYTWSGAALELAQCSAASVCTVFYQIALDTNGRPQSIMDPRSARRAEFAWDAVGHLAVARSPLDVARGWPGTRYEYTPFGLLTAITNSENERIEYAYQSGGRIWSVSQIGEGNPTARFEFHSANRAGLYETLYTNPLGARTRLCFDANTRLVDLELVETGDRRSLTWEGLRPASVRYENGATVTYVHAGDDPLTITDATGNLSVITVEPNGLNLENPRARAIRRIEDSLGVVEERSYDASGRVIALANGASESVDLAYNPASLVDSITQANGVTFTFPLYGAHGHWLDMGGAVSDKRSFDATGNPKVDSAKGRRGGVLTQQFDANRELASLGVAASDASGATASGTITIERRSDGQPLAVRRPYGGDHEFSYDGLGRMLEQRERVDGQWQATSFEHDLAGNTTARSRPNGMREEWAYDGYGRIERYRALRNGTLEGEASYGYQGGSLVSMHDSIRGTSEQHAYDAAGRLVLTTYGYGETRSLEYDARSRVTAEVLAVPGQVLFDIGYAYDLANRLIRTLDRAAQETLVEHVIEAGERAETQYGNGLVRSFAYDGAGLLVAAETRNAANAVLESTLVERTGETDPLRLQVRTQTTTPLAATEEQYWLDAGEKLSDPGRRVFGWSRGSGAPGSFAYDELSNRVSVSGGAEFVYNTEHNRLVSAVLVPGAPPLSYSYDAAGFATARAGVPISWTASGRMSAHGSSTAQWDLSGRLVALAFGSVTRRFDLFGGRVESDAGTGLVGTLDLGEVSLQPLSGTRTYRHLDFRSNVSFVSDDAGLITNHYRYRPFGVDHVYGTGENGNTFVGKPEAGPFLLLGARVYDPAIGRFLSPDPVFTLTNQFVYTSGNPVAFLDESGLRELSQKQGEAVSKFVGWVGATALGVARAVSSGNPAVIAATVVAAVGAGYPIVSGLISAFASESGGVIPGLPVPGAGPLPPDPPSDGGGGGGEQEKKLEFQMAGLVIVTHVGVVSVESPSTCSPSAITNFGFNGSLAAILLAINVSLGLAFLYSRRWTSRQASRR